MQGQNFIKLLFCGLCTLESTMFIPSFFHNLFPCIVCMFYNFATNVHNFVVDDADLRDRL